jgi:NTE family protein
MANEIISRKKKKYAVGYAMSGGFIKGFAHLGVMQALMEHDVHPDVLAGVSAGALSGVFVCDGNEPYEVLDFFKGLHFTDLTKFLLPRRGFFDMSDMITFLRSNLKTKKLENLKIPLIIKATDLDHGCSVVFTRGNIAERVAASCCLPVLFAPICINGVHYVDGGLFGNLPVSTLRPLCEKVVAINVSPAAPEKYKLNMLGIAIRSYHLMFTSNSFHDRDKADLFIEPENLDGYSNRELNKAEEIFNQGYQTTQTLIAQYMDEKGTIWK